MALLNMKIKYKSINILSICLFVLGGTILNLEWVDLVVVVGFGWFLRLFHLVFNAYSISDAF